MPPRIAKKAPKPPGLQKTRSAAAVSSARQSRAKKRSGPTGSIEPRSGSRKTDRRRTGDPQRESEEGGTARREMGLDRGKRARRDSEHHDDDMIVAQNMLELRQSAMAKVVPPGLADAEVLQTESQPGVRETLEAVTPTAPTMPSTSAPAGNAVRDPRIAARDVVPEQRSQDANYHRRSGGTEGREQPECGPRHNRLSLVPNMRVTPPRRQAIADGGHHIPDSVGDGGTVRAERLHPPESIDLMASRINAQKKKIAELEKKVFSQDIANKALTTEIVALEAKVKTLQAENASLTAIARTGRISDHGGGKSKIQKAIPVKYLGVLRAVEENLTKWCKNETMELDPIAEQTQRRWTGRTIEVEPVEGALWSENGVGYIATPPGYIIKNLQWYTPSYRDESDLLNDLVRHVLRQSPWCDVFSDEEQRVCCQEAVAGSKELKVKVTQKLSDVMSARKRNARDRLFGSLGYTKLMSRCTMLTTRAEMDEREDQKREASEKLLKRESNGDLDMGRWRTAPFSELRYSKGLVPDSFEMEVNGDAWFNNRVAVNVLDIFRGYSIRPEQVMDIETSILTLARLDAWLVTTVECLDEPKGKGGARQKEFTRRYSQYVGVAFQQLVGMVVYCMSCLQGSQAREETDVVESEQRTSAQSRHVFASRTVTREAVEVWQSGEGSGIVHVVDDVNRCSSLVLVSEDWIQSHITSNLGAVMDCVIAQGLIGAELFVVDPYAGHLSANLNVEINAPQYGGMERRHAATADNGFGVMEDG